MWVFPDLVWAQSNLPKFYKFATKPETNDSQDVKSTIKLYNVMLESILEMDKNLLYDYPNKKKSKIIYLLSEDKDSFLELFDNQIKNLRRDYQYIPDVNDVNDLVWDSLLDLMSETGKYVNTDESIENDEFIKISNEIQKNLYTENKNLFLL